MSRTNVKCKKLRYPTRSFWLQNFWDCMGFFRSTVLSEFSLNICYNKLLSFVITYNQYILFMEINQIRVITFLEWRSFSCFYVWWLSFSTSKEARSPKTSASNEEHFSARWIILLLVHCLSYKLKRWTFFFTFMWSFETTMWTSLGCFCSIFLLIWDKCSKLKQWILQTYTTLPSLAGEN